MDIGTILLLAILLFAIIYFAVRLAISPLLNKESEENLESNDFGLDYLRDIGVLTNTELRDIIELYNNIGSRKSDFEQYEKSVRVIDELKKLDYLTEEEYLDKISKLKRHFEQEKI
jgi:hypothetical protein